MRSFAVLEATARSITHKRKRRANRATTAQISSAADVLNTQGKFNGRRVIDTTAQLEMIATGSLATDTWVSSGGGTTVTPS